MSLMNHDYAKFMVYDMWIITVNRKLNSLNSVQETNLKHDMIVISLYAMLRNFMKLCDYVNYMNYVNCMKRENKF